MSSRLVPKSPRRVDTVFRFGPNSSSLPGKLIILPAYGSVQVSEHAQLVPGASSKAITQTPEGVPSLPSLEEIETKPIASEIIQLLSRSWLMSLQQLCAIVCGLVNMAFIGQIKGTNSAVLISGVGLSSSFTNVLSVAICSGLTIALGTLLPQCIGAGHVQLATLHVQRAWYLISILAIFLCTIQYFAGDIMIAIGQPEPLRNIVNSYCRVLIPTTFTEIIFLILTTLIQSLHLNAYLLYTNIVSLVCFIPAAYFLIYYTSLGYLGGAVAYVIYTVIQVLGQVFILYRNGYEYIFKPVPLSTIFQWTGCASYIKLALPGVFQESFEWITLEIAVLLSGYVANPATAISTTIIIQQIDLFIYSFSYGIAQSTSIRVAEYIGVGSIEYSQRAGKIGLCLVSCVNVIFLIILVFTRTYIGEIWTYDEEVVTQVSFVIFIYLIFAFSDTIKQTMMGIYRGLGMQHVSAIFVCITSLGICLPAMIVLLFVGEYRSETWTGLYTIWGGLTLANVLAFMLVTVWLFCGCIDWNKAVKEAKARFDEAEKHLKIKNYGSISSHRVL
eukprot:28384_1